ncbi:MAG: UDP-N-acetylglucosamine 2-epimerase (hydrolyzing) [Bacillaceae bacterium]|nr:UDP-N-acetylglucosamine 2-epimerase (hydrolyzing) [Bacillaceae bacterium]
MRKICVVTGTRADYGIYFPLLQKLKKEPDIQLEILATAMHLSPKFGSTYKLIEEEGFTVNYKVDMLLQGSSNGNMARSIGIGILGMSQVFELSKPDFVIVLGDRSEMLAAATAASHLNIPLAHIHGGEVSGSIDESVRHAVTKLSHIHFTSTEKSAERVEKLGEEKWRIFRVGAPRIDVMLDAKLPEVEKVLRKYNIPYHPNNYLLFVYHPVTTESQNMKDQINICLEALKNSRSNVIIILPNSDAGSDDILSVYNQYRDNSFFSFVTNFEPMEYLSILKNTKAMIGNSSSGIIEAATYKVPVLNIGTRQNGRERSKNIIDVPVNLGEIKNGINKVTSAEFIEEMDNVVNIYGDGHASERIVNVLKQIDINNNLISKKITY